MTRKRHNKRPKIHQEGRGIIRIMCFLLFVINVPIFMWQPHWVFAVTLVLTASLLMFVTYFFRNPVRVLEIDDPDFIIAPCDGKVVVIEPTDENDHFHDKRLQVSIFMSPFNVHANWYPVEGTVLRNERSLVVIETRSGVSVMVRQIAGAMARRVVTYAKPGKQCHRNEHLGFIKFGSRVDMYLPLETEMFVSLGETVRGNDTIIARLGGVATEVEN